MEYPLYKVLENPGNPEEALVEKTDVGSVQFTIAEINKFQEEASKQKRETQANLDIVKGEYENIEHHHPFVKDLTEEQHYTVWLYYQKRKEAKEYEDKLPKYIQVLDEYQKEKELILDIIKKAPVTSPIQNV